MDSKFNKLDNENFKERCIFDDDFQVQQMQDPRQFLNNYKQTNLDDTSCIQDFSICCGNICISGAFLCACCQSCSCCVYTLSSSQVGIVESFGKFQRLLNPGFNFFNPCSEDIAEVSMKLKILPLNYNGTTTKDKVKLDINTSVAYRIYNPILTHYILGSNEVPAIREQAIYTIRAIIGVYNLADVLNSRSQIVEKVRVEMLNSSPTGIIIDRIFMEDIQLQKEIERDLTSAARQRRLSEANIIKNQSNVKAAQLMKRSAQLMDSKAAMQIRYLQMVEQLGKKGVVVMMGVGVDKKGL